MFYCILWAPAFLFVGAQDAPWGSEKAQKVRLLLDEYRLTGGLAEVSTTPGESITERALACVHECKNYHLPYCSKSSSLLKMALVQTYNDVVLAQFIYQSELDSATLCCL